MDLDYIARTSIFVAMRNVLSRWMLGVLVVGIATRCSHYHHVLRKGTPEQKLQAAKEYYEKGQYHRVLTLLEDVLFDYRVGTGADEVIYYLGATHFQLGNYLTAAYHFKKVHENFPGSPYAEEALFYYGYSLYLASPPVELDQTNTQQAIEVLQLFAARYPQSRLKHRIDSFIVELQRKLEFKDIRQAYVYHQVEDYKAVVWLVNYFLQVYPTTSERERLMYIRAMDAYELALRSAPEKQAGRFQEAIRYAEAFLSSFPNSKFAPSVGRTMARARQGLKKNTQHEDSGVKEVSTGD